MNLKDALLEKQSKSHTELIASYIGSDQGRFDEIMSFALNDQTDHEALANRAAWVMRECTNRHPDLISPHLEWIVRRLRNGNLSAAVKRQCTRILESIPYPENLLGLIYDCSYQLLADPNESVAVRVYSMTTITNICESEPELSSEASLLIKEHLPYASPAYQARATRELKRLKKFARLRKS